MALNKVGIELLKADLFATIDNPRVTYNQVTFGRVTSCGTFLCMAGLCYARKYGMDEIAKRAMHKDTFHQYQEDAIAAGVEQLGIVHVDKDTIPQIFASAVGWPNDLLARYDGVVNCPRPMDSIIYLYTDPKDKRAMVEIACDALDRLNEDGSIKSLMDLHAEVASTMYQEELVCG